MDDFEEWDHEDDLGLIIGVAHIVVFSLIGWYARRRCCPKRDKQETLSAATGAAEAVKAEVRHLQEQKSLLSSYGFWAIGGVVGIHHFYLNRLAHGLICLWTGNFLMVGWVFDFFLMSRYVKWFNDGVAPKAPMDSSRRVLFVRLPLLVVACIGFMLYMVLLFPATLNWLSIMDLDRLAAQTQRNPYEVLDLNPSAGLKEARTAYHKQSLKWHPDRRQNCGKECDDQMSEITKAFELIKKKRAPAPEGTTFGNRVQQAATEWTLVIQALGKWLDKDQASQNTDADKSDQSSDWTTKLSSMVGKAFK